MNIQKHIKTALNECAQTSDFSTAAEQLLNVLGYRSDLKAGHLSGDPQAFTEEFPSPNSTETNSTKSEKRFLQAAQSVHIIFQITDEEINQADQLSTRLFNKSDEESFLFCAVVLKDGDYARGKYAEFTREINKRFDMPVVVLFLAKKDSKGVARLTLAFVGRRISKTNNSRDVLEKVSLLRNINCTEPHRGHLDILTELSLKKRLKWIDDNKKGRNFGGLLAAWLDKLDADALSKRFYTELLDWFEWACNDIKFPKNLQTDREAWIIRLITRLLFIWFIKEKGLVAENLFIREQIKLFLKNKQEDSDSYYRVVLQNLFFATLNTPIKDRKFSKGGQNAHRDFSLYRYRDEIKEGEEKKLRKLFAQTPFINGGLFDCLDDYDSPTSAKNAGQQSGGARIDYFSDIQGKKLSVPDSLFFDSNKGLLQIFNRYKFTVEESTPIEQEVALDPELLGQVFENLLAVYNPETSENARKQTGSFYTPRAIVDYMVVQALIEAIAPRVNPKSENFQTIHDYVEYLLDYEDACDDAEELFDDDQKRDIVQAIADLTVLDPACGSGAFPMGVLHHLTLALRRIDPENKLWKELQKKRAQKAAAETFEKDNKDARGERLQEINEAFARYAGSDYGRKLFLIQNNIFGVDIQPIACQIAKLRFFISLVIEQVPNKNKKDNFGIKPLPNLETRFVAANTLISIGGGKAVVGSDGRLVSLLSNKADILTEALRQNRERYFNATSREAKLECRKSDKELRKELAAELIYTGEEAEKIAQWDPYDQNAQADWFDTKYMFGVASGFDVVIGNPPYINVENMSATVRKYVMSAFSTCGMRTDIYIAFFEKALSLLSSMGTVSFIVPHPFTTQNYGEKMRRLICEEYNIQEIVDASSYRIFKNATVFNVIVRVGNFGDKTTIRHCFSNSDFRSHEDAGFLVNQSRFLELKNCRLETRQSVFQQIPIQQKIWKLSNQLDSICFVAYGARLNHRSLPIQKTHYISEQPIPYGKKFVEGRDIERYTLTTSRWLNYSPDEHYNPMFARLFESEKIMLIRTISGRGRIRFVYDTEGHYNSDSVINCVRLDMLKNEPHKSARRAVTTGNTKFASSFDYNFILAILNSKLINWYFHLFLGDGLHFYPDEVKALPISQASEVQQRPLIKLAQTITATKAENPNADTHELEAKIDALVYKLYGLTKAEIEIIESTSQQTST